MSSSRRSADTLDRLASAAQQVNAGNTPVGPILVGLMASALLGLAIAIAYLVLLRKVGGVGSGMDGLALAASLFLFPIASFAMTAILWTPFWLWRRSKNKPTTVLFAVIAGALMGLFVGFFFSGFGGFRLRGGAPAFNYAFTALGAFGSGAFQLIARKMGARP